MRKSIAVVVTVLLAASGCASAVERGDGRAGEVSTPTPSAPAPTPPAHAIETMPTLPASPFADGGACELGDSVLPVSDDCVVFSGCGATCGRAVEYYCASGFRPNAPRCLDDHVAIGGGSASCCDAAAVRASSYDGQCAIDYPTRRTAFAVPLVDAWSSDATLAPPPSAACVANGHARGPYVASMIYCCP